MVSAPDPEPDQPIPETCELTRSAYAPSVLPELFSVGPVTVYSFGVMVALAFVVPLYFFRRRLVEFGYAGQRATDLLLAGAVGGIVGARIWWLVENRDSLDGGFFGNAFSGSGLTWYGGAIGGAIAVLGLAKLFRMRLIHVADAAAVHLALGQAIGRIGCELSGDGDYGSPTDAAFPFAHAYPKGTVPTDQTVWATPPMETIALSLIALVLWRVRHRLPPGGAIALYLVLSGIERFLIEFIRRNPDTLGFLTTPQIVAALGAVAGAVWLAVIARRRPRPPLPDRQAAGAGVA